MRGLRLWRRRGGTRAACSIGRGEASSTVAPHTARVLKRVRGRAEGTWYTCGGWKDAPIVSRDVSFVSIASTLSELPTACSLMPVADSAERMTQLVRG